ncbi:MAG TPA: type II toxin-antitoxin system RelB/DinJ family antitoxin [Propylenella sp.]
MKSEFIRARVEPKLKRETEAVLAKLGISMSEAVNVFCRQIVLQNGLPFAVRIPNAETQAALAEDLSGAVRYPDEATLLEAIRAEKD